MQTGKWLTEKQVKKAAAHGRKAALLCSIKHWEQLSSANKEQILALAFDHICSEFCALCLRYDFIKRSWSACAHCGLHCVEIRGTQPGMWQKAKRAFDSYREHYCSQGWAKWKRASKALLYRIIKLYEKEYGEYKHE